MPLTYNRNIEKWHILPNQTYPWSSPSCPNLVLGQCNNQSGPLNTHLIPGPGIYLKAYIHVYSPRAETDSPLGPNVDVNRKPLSLCSFVASFKTTSSKYDFKHILNDFIHVYSPRAGTDKPLGTNFWSQQKALFTLPIRCKFIKRHLILYTFLMSLYMYIVPRQGQTTSWGQTFDVNRQPLSLCPFEGLKNCFEVRFYIYVFHVSPYVYSPGQGQTIRWGQNVDDNRKAFSLCPYIARFKMISLKSDFIHSFNDFIHIHSHGARAETPLGTNFRCQQKAYHFDHLLQVSMFPHVYSLGAGADNPMWIKSWCQH